ncbi:PucR family transcriptional regulator [Tamaricihabitans halophyticus]|uniref:PucR family transcriptional regulator n=1 Tax=Tamaricihabitans halophyticus TaxID=1262583 RepID=UPI001404ACBB|nr:helix-turn-helix domain-containing protein [Tamaricihabitans halophyticus]
MPQLAAIVQNLGSTLLQVVVGTAERPVDNLHIHDPTATIDIPPAGIVLGIGIADAHAASAALAELGSAGATALLLKAPVATDPTVRSAAESADVTVVEVGRGVAWEQLLSLLQRLLDTADLRAGHDGAPGDLFQLANEIGALVNAPITIEDPASRVLAFSSGQEDTDEGRVRTVLGRQVPERYQGRLAEFGVFGQLAASSDPVFVPAVFPDHWPRAVIAVRAGTTTLGYVWAVVRESPPEEWLRAFRACADIVALRLLHERVATTTGSRLHAEQLTALLTRDGDVAETARQLGIAESPVCVIAIELSSTIGAADRMAELSRVSDALGLHLRLVHQATAVTLLDDVVYALLSVADERVALRAVDEFVQRSGSQTPLRAGVGRVVEDPAKIAVSRADADDVLRIIAGGNRATASFRSVRTDLMLLRLAESTGGPELPDDGVVALLLRHDAEHGSQLVSTLDAYLTCFGDIGKAAASLHVHSNTFRYRLARLSDIADTDLSDPDVRLAIMIDLRVYRLRLTMPAPIGPAQRPFNDS